MRLKCFYCSFAQYVFLELSKETFCNISNIQYMFKFFVFAVSLTLNFCKLWWWTENGNGVIPNCCCLVLQMIAVCFSACFAKAFHILGVIFIEEKAKMKPAPFCRSKTVFAGLSYLSSGCIMGNTDGRFWQGEGNASNKIISPILLLPHAWATSIYLISIRAADTSVRMELP